MKTSQRRWLSAVQMAAVAGLTVLLTGLAGALLRRAARRRPGEGGGKRGQAPGKTEQLSREDAEARARMDGEGGSMQPVAVH